MSELVHDSDFLVARGDSLLDEGREAQLPSALDGVSDEEWTQFVRGMARAPLGAVSDSNALGMFAIMPRRLADLGLVERLSRGQRGKRTVWLAVFVAPMTCERFLASPRAQLGAFSRSMRDYDKRMQSGEIDPGEHSRSGALALLHRAGPQGLQTWSDGERFPATEQVLTRVAGIF